MLLQQAAPRTLAPPSVVAEREADRKRQQERSRRKCLAPNCAHIVSLAANPASSAGGRADADADVDVPDSFAAPTLYCSEKCVRDYVAHTIERIRADRANRLRKPLSVWINFVRINVNALSTQCKWLMKSKPVIININTYH